MSTGQKHNLKLKGNKRPWHTDLGLSTPVLFFYCAVRTCTIGVELAQGSQLLDSIIVQVLLCCSWKMYEVCVTKAMFSLYVFRLPLCLSDTVAFAALALSARVANRPESLGSRMCNTSNQCFWCLCRCLHCCSCNTAEEDLAQLGESRISSTLHFTVLLAASSCKGRKAEQTQAGDVA